ncbi:serine protease inhibitor swm-1-like [Prorops nasuta]|uniref:serine protease inhibitor swm-1-like n=1 Tax=Prorops nasuta TaxID=863751 RepID=UPI0034CF7698
MSSKVLFLLFLIVAMASASPRCNVNQVWNRCGSACPPRCNQPDPEGCIAVCVVGCQCIQGYRLNSQGNCVLPQNFTKICILFINRINMSPRILFILFLIVAVTAAAPKCGVNKTWTRCGTVCPPTCKRPHPTICVKMCVMGCQCNKGFLLNSKGNCVLPRQC